MTRGGHLRSIAILKMHEMYVRSLALALARARIHLLELLSLPTTYPNKPALLAIKVISGIKGARAWELSYICSNAPGPSRRCAGSDLAETHKSRRAPGHELEEPFTLSKTGAYVGTKRKEKRKSRYAAAAVQRRRGTGRRTDTSKRGRARRMKFHGRGAGSKLFFQSNQFPASPFCQDPQSFERWLWAWLRG